MPTPKSPWDDENTLNSTRFNLNWKSWLKPRKSANAKADAKPAYSEWEDEEALKQAKFGGSRPYNPEPLPEQPYQNVGAVILGAIADSLSNPSELDRDHQNPYDSGSHYETIPKWRDGGQGGGFYSGGVKVDSE